MTATEHKALINAVETLLRFAMGDTGCATPCALVLLSAYNSYDYALPLAELRYLDETNYEHATAVINACWRGIEPHTVIGDGGRAFETLHHRYSHHKKTKAA